MTQLVTDSRTAWSDRWRQPTMKQLIEIQKEQHQKLLTELIEKLGDFEGVDQDLIWYGTGWQWTFRYTLSDHNGGEPANLAFVVPRPESPMVCLPLVASVIEQLPIKRLSKFIREGIKSAKCAVKLHWAIWTPNNQSEVDDILDLIKRVHKLCTHVEEPAAGNGEAAS